MRLFFLFYLMLNTAESSYFMNVFPNTICMIVIKSVVLRSKIRKHISFA